VPGVLNHSAHALARGGVVPCPLVIHIEE